MTRVTRDESSVGRTPVLFPSRQRKGRLKRGSGTNQGGSCRCRVRRADRDKKDPEGRRGRGHLGRCPREGKILFRPDEVGGGLALPQPIR